MNNRTFEVDREIERKRNNGLVVTNECRREFLATSLVVGVFQPYSYLSVAGRFIQTNLKLDEKSVSPSWRKPWRAW